MRRGGGVPRPRDDVACASAISDIGVPVEVGVLDEYYA